MKQVKNIHALLCTAGIGLIAILIQACSGSANRYYGMEDFAKVRKTDMHFHFNTDDSAIFSLLRKDNFTVIGIVDDRPFGLPMKAQQETAFNLKDSHPDRFSFAATFTVNDWDDGSWSELTLSHLDSCISKGAVAVKVWKNIGMDLRDGSGKFVMIDDPRFDTVLNYLATRGVTLIGHNGEPRDCWLPADQMVVSGNRSYYTEHPEYHMFLHPEYPSYDDQINARDHMLEKHHDLKFVGCHLGSLEWSLDELAKRLDKYPNMAVDLSRMDNLHIHAKNDWKKTHDFFIKYQDRLIYGTDRSVNETGNPENFLKNVHESWQNDWRFFVTDEVIESHDGDFRGLKLPAGVIDKIYRNNAMNWINGMN